MEEKTWSDGEAVTTTELNRAAQGAHAGDEVLQGLIDLRGNAPGSAKRILPLLHESYSLGATATSRGQVARLVMFSVNSATGKVTVKPAVYIVDTIVDTVTGPVAALVAHQTAALDSPQIAANASGVTRYDTIYAAVQYVVSATGARKVKDAAGVSTQVISLAKKPGVSILISQGAGGVPGAVPADGGGIYYFALGVIAVANTYALGGALSETVAPTCVLTQSWARTRIRAEDVQGFRVPVWNTFGTDITGEVIPQHARGLYRSQRAIVLAAAAGNAIVDSEIDYRGRMLRIQAFQPPHVTNAAYPHPSGVVLPGIHKSWDSGWRYYGDGAAAPIPGTIAQTPNNTFDDDTDTPLAALLITWQSLANGNLQITWAGGFVANGGMRLMVIVEYTDPFALPANVP
jgi:hypothetical protein